MPRYIAQGYVFESIMNVQRVEGFFFPEIWVLVDFCEEICKLHASSERPLSPLLIVLLICNNGHNEKCGMKYMHNYCKLVKMDLF